MIKQRYIISVELPRELYAALDQCAEQMHCRKSDIVRWGLKEMLDFLTGSVPVEHLEDDQVKITEVKINGAKE